jgi:hypothetical protein
MRRRLLRALAGAALGAVALALVPAAEAGTLPPPSGKVILKITGQVANRNTADGAEFDLEMLEGLGVAEVVTHTPWTKGERRFSGITMKRLLEAVGASGETVKAVALNDYSIEIPSSDFASYDALVATRIDGKPLRVRDKGPLWVVYPWSSHPEIDNIEYHGRSIWQVKQFEVR